VVVRSDEALAESNLMDDAEPLWMDGRYVFPEPSHNFWRAGPFLVMDCGGTWIGWNAPAVSLPPALAANVQTIHP